MSEDQDKDFSKQRPKKPVGDNRGGGPPKRDYQDNKKGRNNKDYQVYYDQKGDDKSRYQSGQNKGNYSSNYDDYGNKPPRNDRYDNSGNYRPKPHNNPRQKRTGQDQGPNVWRKKTSKISRDSILESFSRVEKHNEIDDWTNNYKELFVSERQQPVNEEVFQLDPNEGLIAKTNTRAPGGPSNYKDNEGQAENKGELEPSSTNTTSTQATGNKDREMFDFGQERFDPIMEMRRRQQEGQGKEGSKAKKEDQWGDLLEEDGRVKGLPKNQFGDDDELGGHEELGGHGDKDYEGLEGEEGGYSDIDAMFEKKLKNNEIQETFEDAFEDIATTNGKKAQLRQMEDAERPEWEDVDTNKVIEDIKKEDFLAKLQKNQNKADIFGDDYLGREIPRGNKSQLPAFSAQTGGFLDELRSDSTKHSSDIDFSSLTFGSDLKLGGQDDFGLNPDDLFSGFGSGISSKPSGGFEGGNIGFLGNPMMQQGNMPRPMQQNPQLVNPAHQLQQFQQYQQMQQMQQGGGFDPMGQQMGPRFGQLPQQPYGGAQQQLPQYKRDPAREMMGAGPGGPSPGGQQGYPRQEKINPSYPSFIFKYFSPNYEDKLWYYIDLQKRVQGPFTGKTMDEWYSNGHLPLTLNVTIGRNSGYKSIKDLADLIVSRTIQGDEYEKKQNLQNQQGQGGFSGINDLLKNRPDLAQYGQGGSQGQRPKEVNEVEGGKFQQPPPFNNQYQRYQNYQDRDREGDYGHRDNYRGGQGRNYGGNDYYENQGGYQKRGGYQNEGPRDMNNDSPNRNAADAQNKTSSPTGENKDKKEQSSPSSGVNLGALGGLQNNTDIASQLKNMLGLGGGALGGLAGLAGLGGIGGGVAAPTTSTTEQPVAQKPVENKPEPKAEKVQAQPEKPVQKEEKVHNNYHEKPERHVEKQEKIVEKVEKQPVQRKGSKAPKIDTSDFPSLGDAYK